MFTDILTIWLTLGHALIFVKICEMCNFLTLKCVSSWTHNTIVTQRHSYGLHQKHWAYGIDKLAHSWIIRIQTGHALWWHEWPPFHQAERNIWRPDEYLRMGEERRCYSQAQHHCGNGYEEQFNDVSHTSKFKLSNKFHLYTSIVSDVCLECYNHRLWLFCCDLCTCNLHIDCEECPEVVAG